MKIQKDYRPLDFDGLCNCWVFISLWKNLRNSYLKYKKLNETVILKLDYIFKRCFSVVYLGILSRPSDVSLQSRVRSPRNAASSVWLFLSKDLVRGIATIEIRFVTNHNGITSDFR
jgi:hypothetical protein